MSPSYRAIEAIDDIPESVLRSGGFCLVEESPLFPGELVFLHPEQEQFVDQHPGFLSRLCMLNDLFMFGRFADRLAERGVQMYTMPTAGPIISRFNDWSTPLEVDGLVLPDGLHPYQQFALNRAFDASRFSRSKRSGFFYNFGTGTGKTVLAAAGAQELAHNRGDIDLVLFFTLSSLRVNMARAIENLTDLRARVPDGAKAKRQRQYGEDGEVVVLNYEKAQERVDFEELHALVNGRRVLWVFDEVQTILHGDNPKNTSRRGIEALMSATRKSIVWPMSASIVKSSPLRYHDCISLITPKHPLGSRQDFVERYCREVTKYHPRPGVTVNEYDWDLPALAEVRHRVSVVTQAVRKTDPGVREYFKGVRAFIEPVQLSPAERKLYDHILDMWEQLEDKSEGFGPYYACLRYIANTPEALLYSDSAVAQQVSAERPDLIRNAKSSKFAMIADKIAEIRDQDDQVVVFTQWTFLTMFLFAKELADRGIDYVTHYGGMTKDARQKAQDTFKANPACTVFLSSDAGAFGLNFQNARYVINIECPYDPDILMQRNDRIDRADSYLEGLTSYIYVADDTVEEGIWKINQMRREVQEALQGTTETLSRFSAEELEMSRQSENSVMHALAFPGGIRPR